MTEKINQIDNLILRWALGTQDTHRLKEYEKTKYIDMLWLTKLSICSFQKWFPHAHFMLFYNGFNFEEFMETFESISPAFLKPLDYMNQMVGLKNPYNFVPHGVWYKWIPMRYDITQHEVSIDTDILCLNEPTNFYAWLKSNKPLLIPPERFSKVMVNTCGDLYRHPVLQGKKPLNCGIVGHLANYDFSERFYEVAEAVQYGYTHDSLFITEQGTINIWVYSLEMEGVQHFLLDFEKNTWVRDLIYYLGKKQVVETVHATAWHKKIIRGLSDVFEKKIFEDDYSDEQFLHDLVAGSRYFREYAKKVIRRQIISL